MTRQPDDPVLLLDRLIVETRVQIYKLHQDSADGDVNGVAALERAQERLRYLLGRRRSLKQAAPVKSLRRG